MIFFEKPLQFIDYPAEGETYPCDAERIDNWFIGDISNIRKVRHW
jgi:hypothetical protein